MNKQILERFKTIYSDTRTISEEEQEIFIKSLIGAYITTLLDKYNADDKNEPNKFAEGRIDAFEFIMQFFMSPACVEIAKKEMPVEIRTMNRKSEEDA